MSRVFMNAEWRKLVMVNYEVDPTILASWVPAGTEIDKWKGKCYISLVGFLFDKVKLRGWGIPFHRRFPEVNLRFYVRYREKDNWKRGVVFISEIVPKPAISFVANTLYRERYRTLPMKHSWINTEDRWHIAYQWKKNNRWNKLEVVAGNIPVALAADSEEEFITEHFWGYSGVSKTVTGEYQVEHPRWEIYPVNEYRVDCDFEALYGKEFGFLKQQTPRSVFLAEGSPVRIYSKRIL
jgi:Uncharacterized conserved protein